MSLNNEQQKAVDALRHVWGDCDRSTRICLKGPMESVIRELEAAQAKLLASEAAGAEMRRLLEYAVPGMEVAPHLCQAESWMQAKAKILSTPCGQSFLDEREWMRELLAYVRENVTVEIAAHGDCSCDIPAGDTPCVYCASIHFNERTGAQGTALNPHEP